MAKIFISYRRADSQHAVDRLYAGLAKHVSAPKRDIFMDVDNIPLGADFVEHLSGKVSECETLLCVIGPGWLAEIQRRKNDPKDFVRIEIEAALKRNIQVIPILLDGAPVPDEAELPDSIAALSRRNGTELRRQTFDANVETLAKGLGLIRAPESSVERPKPAAPTAPKPPQRSVAPLLGGVAVLALLGGGAYWASEQGWWPLGAGEGEVVRTDPVEPVAPETERAGIEEVVSETTDSVEPANTGPDWAARWAEVDQGDPEAVRAFLDEEPTGVTKDEAQTQWLGMAAADWGQTLAAGTVDAYRTHAERFAGTNSAASAAAGVEGHGNAIRALQTALRENEFYTGAADGVAGPGTTQAVSAAARAIDRSAPDLTRIDVGPVIDFTSTLRAWTKPLGLTGARELRTLEGHGDFVFSAAFSPDGRFVVTGSRDKTAKLWEAGTGRLLRTLEGHGSTVISAAFSPDGRYVVTVSDDNAKLWEAGTGRLLRTLEGHEDYVGSAAFNPDGRFIVTGSRDKTAKLWETGTGRLLRTLTGHGDMVWSAAFSPDGRFVVTGSSDNTAKLWEADTGQLLRTLEGHGASVYSAAFSPDGRFILTGSDDNTARLWEAGTGRLLRTLEGHEDYVISAAFSPDGRFILTGSGDNTAKLWEAGTGQLLRTLEGHGDFVRSAAFSPDGRFIVTGSDDGTAKLWELQFGE